MGIKCIDSIDEKKGALGNPALTKKGLRRLGDLAKCCPVSLSETLP
jgi:hypothetical protein